MVDCARCGDEVGTVHRVTPDVITEGVIDSIDHGEKDLVAREGDMQVCGKCLDDLKGE